MALTGVIQRRDKKVTIIQNPPRAGEIVYALDTDEYGSLIGGVLTWKKFDDLIKSVAGRTGDIVLSKYDVQLGNVDNTSDIDKPVSLAVQNIFDAHSNSINPHNITSELLGLGNVDDTSDVDKPVSTATQIAIDQTINDKINNLSEINNTLNLIGIPGDEYALKANYFTKNETTDLLNTKSDNTEFIDLTDRVNSLEMTQHLKADKTYVNNEISALDIRKAEKSVVDSLIEIVDLTDANVSQNTENINNLSTNKADVTYVDESNTEYSYAMQIDAGGSFTIDTDFMFPNINNVNLLKCSINFYRKDYPNWVLNGGELTVNYNADALTITNTTDDDAQFYIQVRYFK